MTTLFCFHPRSLHRQCHSALSVKMPPMISQLPHSMLASIAPAKISTSPFDWQSITSNQDRKNSKMEHTPSVIVSMFPSTSNFEKTSCANTMILLLLDTLVATRQQNSFCATIG